MKIHFKIKTRLPVYIKEVRHEVTTIIGMTFCGIFIGLLKGRKR